MNHGLIYIQIILIYTFCLYDYIIQILQYGDIRKVLYESLELIKSTTQLMQPHFCRPSLTVLVKCQSPRITNQSNEASPHGKLYHHSCMHLFFYEPQLGLAAKLGKGSAISCLIRLMRPLRE